MVITLGPIRVELENITTSVVHSGNLEISDTTRTIQSLMPSEGVMVAPRAERLRLQWLTVERP